VRIHRIYCKSVSGKDSTFDLDQSQSRHLSKVLRLKIDDKVEVFDGHGAVAICKILVINRFRYSLRKNR
jgi:16S rRNA U1498 N3-methylase RsmE